MKIICWSKYAYLDNSNIKHNFFLYMIAQYLVNSDQTPMGKLFEFDLRSRYKTENSFSTLSYQI